MVPNSLRQIVGHADVKSAVPLAGNDVDIEGHGEAIVALSKRMSPHPLVPAKAGTQEENREVATSGLDSRLRGNERSLSGVRY
jgi:hypothetical protein